MTAVVFVPYAAGTVAPWGVVIAALSVVILAAGLQTSPIRHPRLVFGIILTVVLTAIAWPLLAQLVCGACINCDPWYLEWFWICI